MSPNRLTRSVSSATWIEGKGARPAPDFTARWTLGILLQHAAILAWGACNFIQPAAGKDLSWSINSMTGKLSISHGSAGRPCRSIKARLA